MATVHELPGAVPARAPAPARGTDLPDWLRNGFTVLVMLLIWVRADPFHDLTSVSNIEAQDGGSLATQVSFSLVGLVVLAILNRIGFRVLRPLATWPLLATAGWFGVNVVLSVAPSVSLRRAILLAIVIATAATLMLVARNARHFATLLAGTALAVLAVCYVSLAVVPDLAMHTALDLREPEHAGAWRGVFPHKNEAGSVMVVFVLVGLFAFGTGQRLLGGILAALAAFFLAFTFSKTAVATLPLVLMQTALSHRVRGRLGRALVLLGPLTLLLTMSLGSLFLPPVKGAVAAVLPDVTFTGRTEIWDFAAEKIRERPLTGWGFGAFWKTEQTLYGSSEKLTWVNQADQAHNGYLDLALLLGVPGLLLSVLVFVLMPLRDIDALARRGAIDPSARFFERIWLFGLSTAAFESIFYDSTNSTFFMFASAVLGLRFLVAYGSARA